MSETTATVAAPELTVVVPTREERDSIEPLYRRLCGALAGIEWEVIFVDDDSRDGTPQAVRALARLDRRVRLLHRLGRRGLSSAATEGFQASTSDFIAVMDADLQHDEALLPRMLQALRHEPIDLVVGSRYLNQSRIADWDEQRQLLSSIATRLGRRFLRTQLSDPMSGYFMIRREAFEAAMRRLSSLGFKILLDIIASSPGPLRVKELSFEFRARQAGESKFSPRIGLEYLVLLLDKLIGHILPIRLVLFAGVGALGLLAHLAVLWLLLYGAQLSFSVCQTIATLVAMVGNFTLNNWLTYRDMRLTGWRWARGLVLFCLICSLGAVANIGIASVMVGMNSSWWVAGIVGATMSLVWNYTMTSVFTWRKLT